MLEHSLQLTDIYFVSVSSCRRPAYTSSLFNCWEILLQEVEVDSQVHGDIARSLSQNVGVMLLEKTFFRKIQSRKIFLHRESFETILTKAEELLAKVCYSQQNQM